LAEHPEEAQGTPVEKHCSIVQANLKKYYPNQKWSNGPENNHLAFLPRLSYMIHMVGEG